MKIRKLIYLLSIFATPAAADVPTTIQGIWAGSPEDCIDSQIIISRTELNDQFEKQCFFAAPQGSRLKGITSSNATSISGNLFCQAFDETGQSSERSAPYAFRLKDKNTLLIEQNPFGAIFLEDYYADKETLTRCSE